MMRYLEAQTLRVGDVVYEVGDRPEALYVVLSGEVTCEIDFAALSKCVLCSATRPPKPWPSNICRRSLQALASDVLARGKVRYLQYAAGGVTGDMEFFLQRPRTFRAICTSEARLLALTHAAYQRMVTDAPRLLVLLQHMILRNEMLSSSNALELLERARAT